MNKYHYIMIGIFLFQLTNTVLAVLYLGNWSQNISFLSLGFITAIGLRMIIEIRSDNKVKKMIDEIRAIYKEAQEILASVKEGKR